MAGRPRRTNNWGLRGRPWARRLRKRRDRAVSATSERYSRWTALGTLIAGLAGALSLVVSAAVAYQGVLAWRDQTAQERREADDEAMRQAAAVGVWSEGSTTHWWRWSGEPPLDETTADPADARYIVENTSPQPIRQARLRTSLLVDESAFYSDIPNTLRPWTLYLGTIPPCTQVVVHAQDFADYVIAAHVALTRANAELRLNGVTFRDARGVEWLSQLHGDNPLARSDHDDGAYLSAPYWASAFSVYGPPEVIYREQLPPALVEFAPSPRCGPNDR